MRLTLNQFIRSVHNTNIQTDYAGDHSEASGTSLHFRISRFAPSSSVMLQSPTSTDGEGFSLNLSNDSLPSPAWNSPSPQPNLNITDVMGKIFFSFKSQFTIASHLTGCSPEVAKLTPQIIRGVPRGHALSPRIVEFVQNYAACRNLQPADLKYYLNGVSAYLCSTEKERESRRGIARAAAERYAKARKACEARLMDLAIKFSKKGDWMIYWKEN